MKKMEVYISGKKQANGKHKLTFIMAMDNYPPMISRIYEKFKQIYKIRKIYTAYRSNGTTPCAYIETKC